MKKFLKALTSNKGFTLIELIVVIAIIAMLVTTGAVAFGGAQKGSRIAKRQGDLKAIETALEFYYAANGSYPINPTWAWRSECTGWGGHAANDVIPGLVPTYMKSFPSDPSMKIAGNTSCYLYLSNGTDYKLLDHDIADLTQEDYAKSKNLIDPVRDSGTNRCLVDGTKIWSWAIYSSGGCGW